MRTGKRLLAAGVLGGAAVAAGWVGIARLAAGEPFKPAATTDGPVWTRSSAPAAAPPPIPPADAAGVLPAASPSPAKPATPKPAPPPPAFALLPLPGSVTPPEVKDTPPEVKDTPPAERPVAPVIPPPPGLAPPAPPEKSVLPLLPDPVPPPDFNLRPSDPAHSVKPEAPVTSPGPVPPLSLPAPKPVVVTPVLPAPPPEPLGTPTGRVRGPSAPTPGDNTMTGLNKTVLAAVVGGALALTPTRAAAQPPQPTNEELKKQLEAANLKLDELKRDVKRLSEALEGRRDEKGYPLPSDPGLVAELKRLRDRVDDVERAMRSSTSLRPNTVGPVVTPALTGRGTVRVVNEYATPVSIVVNSSNYRVEPNRTLDVDVPTGEFTYHLLAAGVAPTRSVIKDKEVVTLRVR
jgi:hypothetical protein